MDLKHRNKEHKTSRSCATFVAVVIVLLQCALFRHHSRIWVLIKDNDNEASQPIILPSNVEETPHREQQQPEVLTNVQAASPDAPAFEKSRESEVLKIENSNNNEVKIASPQSVSSQVIAPNDERAAPDIVARSPPHRASRSVTVGTFPPPDDNPCNVTIVTGLYDLGREAFDGRSFETYQEWFGETLETALQPMVVYVPNEALKQFVIQHRPASSLTKIIIEPEYPLQYLIPNVTTILNDPDWIWHMAFPKDLTNKLPAYTLIQHSKFVWLQEVIRDNPFDTQQFLWLDAGVSRLWHGGMQTVGVRPNVCAKEDQFNIALGSILLPLGRMVKDWPDDRSIGSQKNFFRGTPWLMRAQMGLQVCELALSILMNDMIRRGRIDNEQITLWLVYRRHPEWFRIWRQKDVRPMPIAEILGNGTGVGFWLAQ